MRKLPLFFTLLMILFSFVSCNSDQKIDDVSYTVTFYYKDIDEDGIRIIEKEVKTTAHDGEKVYFPTVPSIVDSKYEKGLYFTGKWESGHPDDPDYQWLDTIICEESFFLLDHMESTTSGIFKWHPIYSYAFKLYDGNNTQTILCDTTNCFEMLYALNHASTELEYDKTVNGWTIKWDSIHTHDAKQFDSLRIDKSVVDTLIAVNDDIITYYLGNSFSTGESHDELCSLMVDAYLGEEHAFTIPLLTATNSDNMYFWFDWEISGDLSHEPLFSIDWKPYPTVKFISGSETSQSTVIPNTTVDKPLDPEYDGYKFMWWSLDEAGEAFDFNTPILEDTVLYAVYKQLFTVTFINEGLVSSVQVPYGEYTGMLNPTKTGYILKGWSLTDGGDLFDFENTPITSNTVLFAVWEEA